MPKRFLRWAAIAAGVLLAVCLALPFLVNANTFRPALETKISAAMGREVKLGDLKLAILSGGVSADNLSIADDPAYSRSPFLQAKAVRIGVEILPLVFSRKLNVTGVTVDEPQITLIESQSGEWNFSSLGNRTAAPRPGEPAAPGGKGLDLSVKEVKIVAGRFSVGRAAARYKPLVLEQVNAGLRDFSSASAFPFSFSARVLGGGEIKLEGTAGPLDGVDMARTPATATLKIAQFDLAGSGWTQATPGMGGVVALDGRTQSDGKTAQVNGRVTIEKLKLSQRATPAPHPVQFDFTAEHNWQARAGRLTRGEIHIGQAAASLTGSYAAQGESTVLRMSLAGPNMPVPELAGMLPALGVTLPAGSSLQGGTATVKLAMEGPVERLVTTGTVGLNHTTLAGFDLGRKMAVIEALAGIPGGPNTEIESLGGKVRIAPEGTTAEELQLIVPTVGDLGGGGAISPANELDFKMTVKLHTARLMASVADRSIPFQVKGTCADPVFRPDVKAAVKDEAKGLLKRLFSK